MVPRPEEEVVSVVVPEPEREMIGSSSQLIWLSETADVNIVVNANADCGAASRAAVAGHASVVDYPSADEHASVASAPCPDKIEEQSETRAATASAADGIAVVAATPLSLSA